MRRILLQAIRVYQAKLSPIKGFSCAHRHVYGGQTCSCYSYSAIAQYGSLRGILLTLRRFRACGSAYKMIKSESDKSDEKRRDRKKHKENDDAKCCFLAEAAGELSCCAFISFF